ncbi:hypothetical protein CORC01_06767 [Colletotrichum orchidophilum]|uniref:Uncharacterized protein n=1 Tax=Colletotrichum orchidophilum TaxID=1209926 RepID=A0A1G4B904_9PEZI|nr:uncharacterized protein CORC01_06767 [Colletotrichum orchidophilum]OHE97904.1 hypothetical protein CORC01_06767 [Colletotrichum orchidophilum]
MDPRDVAPDEVLLNHIFPDQPQVSISVILQNWDKCVFKASFQDFSEPCCPCIVRVEVMSEDEKAAQFTVVSAMQKIAAGVIQGLVPNTFQTGVAENAQGKRFQFCVMEFIEGDTLEEVWDLMSSESQRSVVAALVGALRKLHTIQISDDRVQAVLRQALDGSERDAFQKAVVGGPSTGFLEDGPTLLGAITKRLELKKPFYTITPIATPGDIVIKSHYEDLGSVTLGKSSIEQWEHEAVFCHNDLTPRNIIVRPYDSPDGSSNYKLSAIIDWEISGFYPASYELSLQDTYLSGANRLISFYLLLKRQMKDLVPHSSSQISLLQTMELLFESRQRRLVEGSNIPAVIRQRFVQRLQLRRDEDPYIGWVPEDEGAAQPVFSRADAQSLEDDVVAEIIGRG